MHIKKFIDRVSLTESRSGKDVILPISEARALRDEICRMLADRYNIMADLINVTPATGTKIEVMGGKFK